MSITDELMQELRQFCDEGRITLQQLDSLAGVWGDEAVFRRCRDRLRNSLKQAEECCSHDDD